MVCPRQMAACCLTLVTIIVNARQTESRSNAGNESFHVSCSPAHWDLAQKSCTGKHGAMFELGDLKKNYGLPVLQAALRDVGEMWINIDKKGGCMKAVKMQQREDRNKSADEGDSNKFEATNCTELHHYVCKINKPPGDSRRTNDSEPQYVPCQSHPTASGAGYIYMAVVGVVLVLFLSTFATCLSVRRLRGRVPRSHSNAVQNPNGGTPSDNADHSELQTQDKDIDYPVEQIDLRSVDTDHSAFLEETFDTYDDPAGLSDHSEDNADLAPSPREDGAVVTSDTYDNVTYFYDL